MNIPEKLILNYLLYWILSWNEWLNHNLNRCLPFLMRSPLFLLTVLQFYDLPRTMECLGSTSPHQRNQGRTHISPILMPIINLNIDGHWTGYGILLFSRFIDIQRNRGYNLNTSVWHFGPVQNTLPWGNLLWFPKSGVNQSNGNQFKFFLLKKDE